MACKETGKPKIGANMGRRNASESAMTAVAGALPQTPEDSTTITGPVRVESRHKWVVRLMRRDGAGIQRLLWRLLGREADVLDAFQDCFCRLASRDKHAVNTNARAYAYRTATNIAIEMIRTRRRHATHLPTVAVARRETRDEESGADVSGERYERLRNGIAGLPEHLRNVVVLRDLNRFSYAKVGRMLGIEPTTARVYRRHAVVRLAELIGEGEEP